VGYSLPCLNVVKAARLSGLGSKKIKERDMPQFVMTYLGGNPPSTPEEGQKHFAEYQQWLGSLGDAAVSPMNPFKNTHVVKPDGSVTQGSGVAMTGYTIVEADDMEAALEMAKSCPFLGIDGTLEVSELVQMG
jgi:hypothetical protein